VTISALATAGGTLILAVATFASVRSANRAARVAEASLLAGIRPLLVPSRIEDPEQKVGFADDHFVHISGGGGTADVEQNAIYLTMSIRNAGNGIAVLHGWRFDPAVPTMDTTTRPPVDGFNRLTRDIYISSGDVGFWQGAIRDSNAPEWDELASRIKAGERIMIDILYGDLEGGQRTISRFSMQQRSDGAWMATVSRHWNLDRPDPR